MSDQKATNQMTQTTQLTTEIETELTLLQATVVGHPLQLSWEFVEYDEEYNHYWNLLGKSTICTNYRGKLTYTDGRGWMAYDVGDHRVHLGGLEECARALVATLVRSTSE